MPKYALADLLSASKVEQILRLAEINAELEQMTAQQRVRWALEYLDGNFALASSFGIQSAVMLHLVTLESPNIPVILTDTGYLFPETYQFVDFLTERLSLNLKVYRAELSPAWQEARYGQLWTQGVDGIKQYNKMNKVEPMRRALEDLQVNTWFSGLRRAQSSTRATLPVLAIQNGKFKFLPLIDWSEQDIDIYLLEHDLPYHPLREQGYRSMGDVHTTTKWVPGMAEEETRFFGLKRECGLHEDDVESDGSGI
ncbi:phosphoadenylyl-sulfate reductase [Photobacterium sp. 1_MG-2023]|uniref:phosphoadenylyl-sulfate reductase n=1 Tax=Photobacterium sp. 1_MG-2023 TaxID=3062646 RepID=UPI0026E27E67|nr:phosphoadenylyl-sulfate reductase [Photobacterium sp. 1_MG-2023]MDO6708790.1 phosphoadenylyl-sulfate reductase [Photobacterium sp. 1_MG-2023]